MRVLVVDPEPVVIRVIVAMLSRVGHDVKTATSASDALRQTDAGITPDVLITDLVLPGINGVSLAKQIRSTVRGIGVVITETGEEDLMSKTLHQDFSVLSKPFSENSLRDAVAEALERAAMPGAQAAA